MEFTTFDIIEIVCIVFTAGITIGNIRIRITRLEDEQTGNYKKLHTMLSKSIDRFDQRMEKTETRIVKIETDLTRHDEILTQHTRTIEELQQELKN